MDRMDSGVCVKCGMPLIDLNNPRQLCSACTDSVERSLYEWRKPNRKKERRPEVLGKRKHIHPCQLKIVQM